MNPKCTYYDNGNVKEEKWFANGVLHCEGDPAVIRYNLEGHVINKCWYREGKLHREDGPALLQYDSKGYYMSWWENNLLHRLEAASEIYYNYENRSMQALNYHAYGIALGHEVRQWIKDYPLPENAALFRLTWAGNDEQRNKTQNERI